MSSGRALIIDKEAAFAERLEATLRHHGFEVATRSTGRDGIDEAKASRPDLIILCVELDDTSGYSICAKIKKDSELKNIPLVITSEKATQETFDHHKKLKTRAQVYLMKPCDPDQLLHEVQPFLELAAQPAYGADDAGEDDANVVEIEDVEVEASAHDPLTIGDDDAFGDAGRDIDAALASLRDEPPPVPAELGGLVGLPADLDEDDIRTTIGVMPSSSADDPPSISQRLGYKDLPLPELMRRLKEAERARDDALASERAIQAQLQALAAGASQLPAQSTASREVLAVKKELNAKERELLELRDQLQERDRQLLQAREREAELEEKVVQTEDARNQADRARLEAESRIAGAEARAEEIERSSRATIEDLDGQIEGARRAIEGLEEELADSRAESGRLREEVARRDGIIAEYEATIAAREQTIAEHESTIADREQTIAEHESTIAAREQTIAEHESTIAAREQTIAEHEATIAAREDQIRGLEDDLERAREEARGLGEELAQAREEIEGLHARIDGLDRDLDEARGENEALRGALADTEDRLGRALRRIRDDEDIRGKAKQAIEITLKLLDEAEYGADGDELSQSARGMGDGHRAEDASV